MLKNKIWLGIILSILLLVFGINGFTADYKYTQESGAGFFVGTGDKADALEDQNELRQIVNDLGNLLGHSKMDGLYPKDLTTGGYLGRLNSGLDASKPAVPVVNDMYLATDTVKIYRCFVAGNWVQIYPSAGVDTSGTPEANDIPRFTDLNTIEGLNYTELKAALDLEIGTDVQAYDAGLSSLAALTYVSPSFIKVTAEDTYAIRTLAEVKTDLAYQLSDMSDVGVTTPTNKHALMGDGNSWESRAIVEADISDLGTYLEDITLESIGSLSNVDLTDLADGKILKYNNSTSKFECEDESGGGYTNLTSFVDQTAWRLFYSNADGDVVELPLGVPGTYLKSTGATSIPEFDTPAGGGYSNIVVCADYDHPDDAITAIGGSDKTLLVTETETCDTNFTVPGNVKVIFERGGFWTIENGITVTFNGQLEAGLWQIFSYTGTGTLAGTPIIKFVYPQWWATSVGSDVDPWDNLCIESAYTFCPTGGTIYLITGYYELDDALVLSKAVNIIGEGMGITFIVTANAAGLWFGSAADYVTVEGFTMDGDVQDDNNSDMRVINISGPDYITIRNVEVRNGGYYGLNIFEVNNCTFQNIYAHDNYRHGVHLGSDTSGRGMYNVCRDIYCWDNGVSGFSDRGADTPPSYPIEDAYGVYDNIQAWDNTQEGIAISQQKSGILSNSFASGNGNKGIAFFGLEEFDIHDCLINTNTSDGVLIDGCDDLVFTNVIAKNNTEDGFNLNDSSGIKFNSCRAYDDRGEKVQIYGLETAGTSTNIELVNCDLRGNLTGRIANNSSAKITGTDVHPLIEDHDYSGKWKTGVVGETVVYGQLLYHNFADDWKESDADAAATMPGLRIALEGGDDGDTILMLIEGDIRDDSFYEFAASMVYAGTDVGGIVSTAPSGSGDQVQRIGVAESADAFYFNPSIDVGEVK